jgi:sec-independent protein translocase protein TatA
MNLGPLEIVVILFVALLIFGPKNLPKLGKSLGQTVKNVREGMEGDSEEEPKKVEAPKATEVVAEPAADTDADADVEEDVVFCSKCGAKNAADAAFCSKCGNKLSAE